MLWFSSTTLLALSIFWVLCWYCLNAEDTILIENDAILNREKRNLLLVFPVGGTSKLLLGWAIPIKNPANISLVFGANFQFQYAVPPNITIFSKYYPYSTITSVRKKRSQSKNVARYEKDRYMFYRSMEESMNGFGVNGRECLLRTICEAAETPIYHNGYAGELFHLLLTPKYVEHDNHLYNDMNAEYYAAKQAGDDMYDCRELYPKCPKGHGLFDLISVLE